MRKNNIKLSVVIRAHNEARWIKQCINRLNEQSILPDEIILIDNNSTDGTVQICKSLKGIKIFKYGEKYIPGKMLNYGISKAKNNFVIILSAHCIPYNKHFIENLVKPVLKDKKIVATYSRQVPLDISDPLTVRDLMIAYGPESRLQKYDPQFNNASSLIIKKEWNKNKFNENEPNLEDRIWAAEILKKKKYIYYAANSIVYHYHGSHHNNSELRLISTNKVIKKNKKNFNQLAGKLKYDLKSIIPIFILRDISKQKLHDYYKYLTKQGFKKMIFLTNKKPKIINKNVKFIVRKTKEYKEENIYLDEVIKYYMDQILKHTVDEEYMLICTNSYLHYDKKIINKFLQQINLTFPQVLFFAKKTQEPIFIEENKTIQKINYFLKKERSQNSPIYIADRTKGMIIHISNLYKNSIFDGKISLCF